VEFFRTPNLDFLGKKWIFLGLSCVVVIVSAISLATRGLNYGIDFRGGADVVLRFVQEPAIDEIRGVLESQGLGGAQIQKLISGNKAANDLLVRVPPQEGATGANATESDVSGRVLAALRGGLGTAPAPGRLDLNLAGLSEVRRVLNLAFPGQEAMVEASARALATFREEHNGLFGSVEEARQVPGVSPEVAGWLRDNATVGPFAIRSVDYVGPSVGAELKKRALYAVIGSLIAMLVYIWFRFEKLAYGVSAIITLGHDALVALGAVSLTWKEFDLTVLAADLTIVGYSINDTIVIFDRVRENQAHRRGGGNMEKLFNDSINQTLSRTILTVALVMMVVLTLWIFGGSRLNPFSFTLLVGIIVGSYSTIYVSAPLVIWWRKFVEKRATT
jgi:preprotein translocase subunit SecF